MITHPYNANINVKLDRTRNNLKDIASFCFYYDIINFRQCMQFSSESDYK